MVSTFVIWFCLCRWIAVPEITKFTYLLPNFSSVKVDVTGKVHEGALAPWIKEFMYAFSLIILAGVHIVIEENVGRTLFQMWLPGAIWYRILATIGYFIKLSVGFAVWIFDDMDWVLMLASFAALLHFI